MEVIHAMTTEKDKYKSQEEKLKQVLNILLQEDFKASDDVYLEKIISHLSGKFDKDLGKYFLQQPACYEWIQSALQKWIYVKPHHSIVAFCVKMMSLLVSDKEQFQNVRGQGMLTKLIDIIKTYEEKAVVLSYIVLLNALIQHIEGLQFVLGSGVWREIISFSKEKQTMYISRESNQFIYNIILKSSTHSDIYNYKEILSVILEPISKKKWKEENNVMPLENSYLYETLSTTINLLNFILEQSLKNREISDVIRYMLIEYKLEWHYWNLLSVTFDEGFLKLVIKMIVLVIFCKLRCGSETEHKEITKEDLSDFCANSYNIINIVIVAKRLPLRVLQICELYHLFWNYLKKGASDEDNLIAYETNWKFESQMTLLQLTPILFAIKSSTFDLHTFFEEYIMKLYNIAGEHTIRLTYAYRDSLKGHTYLYDIAHQAILSLLSTKSLLAQDRVIIIFQALVYILKDFAPEASSFPVPENYVASEIISKAPHLLGTILTALCTLIKDYKISWFDSIESTAVLKFSLALLENTNISTKLTIQALQLTQLSIERYMAPNLALLLNRVEGAGLEKLGPTIKKKIHDPQWEVRDSALELLQSVSTIAKCKYPAFQCHVLDSDLPSLTCVIAEADAEAYVRASAWKCVKIMLRIDLLWTKSLQGQDLQTKLKKVILDDDEAIVRQEAICALTQLMARLNIIPSEIYSLMQYITIHDLHWEVQVNALSFWKAAFQRECHNQGMIDGSFPSVTFSRESHKIVNLDNAEIQSRLQLILNALAEKGFFEVLFNCLNENTEVRVLQEACDVNKLLIDLLQKYDFKISLMKQKENDKTPTIEHNVDKDVKKSLEDRINESVSESVIDSIVDQDDINLLSTVYNHQMTFKSTSRTNIFPRKVATPHEFLSHLESFDINKKLQMKYDWLLKFGNDFENLLDDIISCHSEKLSSNDMDCY